ncbi:MAG: serine/threonine protein kinase [Actinobacteria bacterium]|nr:MAG: serine/threonine protein kinase [Actinomycetota bacterium]
MERAAVLHHDHLVLGRYRPLRPLGSGGSGSVWLARDERAAREVALKVVPREGKAGSRAEREVEAAARLRHPRCLRALDLHRDDQHVYVAYEYVPGRTLREALRAGDLDDAAAVEAGAQILEALAHAHSKGVVHRDVKPANVMLEEGDGVSVRLLDFGLARVEEADTLTAVGDVPGTLAYIAPERLDGEPATGAADVWAVGVMLWEALAGWHPFAAVSPVETARRIGEGAGPLAGQRPDLPRALCSTVDRLLTADAGRRAAPRRAAEALRTDFAERERRPRPAVSRRALADRAVHAACAALVAGGATALLPFFPRGWPFLLGAIAGLTALRSPVAGLAFALAVPVLPLGNLSLGLALAYAALALAWFALFFRRPGAGLLVAAGPLLGPLGLLAAAPAVALSVRDPIRRAAIAGLSVLAAAAAAGGRQAALPLGAGDSGSGLGVAGSESALGATRAVAGFLVAHPALPVGAAVAAAAAAALPYARARGLWGAAGWGACLLAGTLLAPALAGSAAVPALGTTVGVWLATAVLIRSKAATPR